MHKALLLASTAYLSLCGAIAAPIVRLARRLLAFFAPYEFPPQRHEYAAPPARLTARLTRNHRDTRRDLRTNLSPRHCIS